MKHFRYTSTHTNDTYTLGTHPVLSPHTVVHVCSYQTAGVHNPKGGGRAGIGCVAFGLVRSNKCKGYPDFITKVIKKFLVNLKREMRDKGKRKL